MVIGSSTVAPVEALDGIIGPRSWILEFVNDVPGPVRVHGAIAFDLPGQILAQHVFVERHACLEMPVPESPIRLQLFSGLLQGILKIGTLRLRFYPVGLHSV